MDAKKPPVTTKVTGGSHTEEREVSSEGTRLLQTGDRVEDHASFVRFAVSGSPPRKRRETRAMAPLLSLMAMHSGRRPGPSGRRRSGSK